MIQKIHRKPALIQIKRIYFKKLIIIIKNMMNKICQFDFYKIFNLKNGGIV